MQLREKLLSNYPNLEFAIDDELPEKLGGLYIRDDYTPYGSIYVSGKLDYYKQNSIIAEEIGHHETTTCNIINAYSKKYDVNSAKQELQARRYGYNLLLPLKKLIECYKCGIWDDLHEICSHLEIDTASFSKIIEDYKVKFGTFVIYDGFKIEFEHLSITKI